METHIYFRPTDLSTAEHIERCLGRQSAYAHSTTLREGEETSQGLSEQGIPLLTAWEIRQLKDDEIIGFHRNIPPFQMKRIDWRHHRTLQHRRSMPAPQLPTLPQIADIPDMPEKGRMISPSFAAYIDPDMLHYNGATPRSDLSKQEQEADRLT